MTPGILLLSGALFPDTGGESAAKGPQLDTSFHKHIDEPQHAAPQPPEFTIISCPRCGVKNKVNNSKLILDPKCGKCRAPLIARA